jgi:hypothetical protein
MMAIYVGALAFGGTLLAATLILGGDHGGHDGSFGHDHEAGNGNGDGGGMADIMGWLPVTSLRFWTFFLGFGGAVGAVLTWRAVASAAVVGGVAGVVGWVSGVSSVAILRTLRSGSVDSSVEASDLVGASGAVVVAIPAGDIGKVRFEAKGRQMDVIAVSDDGKALAAGTRVVVVGEDEDGPGRVVVAPEPEP